MGGGRYPPPTPPTPSMERVKRNNKCINTQMKIRTFGCAHDIENISSIRKCNMSKVKERNEKIRKESSKALVCDCFAPNLSKI